MDIITVITTSGVVSWLMKETGGFVFQKALNFVAENFGMREAPDAPDIATLLDEKLGRLRARLDEDRLVRLNSAFSQLREATRRKERRQSLEQALSYFHEVSNLPESGATGGTPNSVLRCMAFLGIAVTYFNLGENQELIAQNLVAAFLVDRATAEPFLGKEFSETVADALTSRGAESAIRRQAVYGPQSRVQRLPHNKRVTAIRFSPDGKTIASGSEDGYVRLWDAAGGALLWSSRGRGLPTYSLDFSPDGSELLSACFMFEGGDYERGSSAVELREVETGEMVWGIRSEEYGWDRYVAARFSDDGKMFVAVSCFGEDIYYTTTKTTTLTLRKSRTGALVKKLYEGFHNDFLLSPDLGTLVKVSKRTNNDYEVSLFDARTGEFLREVVVLKVDMSLAFSADSSLLAVAERLSSEIKLWYAATGTPVRTLDPVPDGDHVFTFSHAIAFSPDASTIAGVTETHPRKLSDRWPWQDKTYALGVWDVRTGKVLHFSERENNKLASPAYSPGSAALAVIDDTSNAVRILRL